jgi:hypothetical protein
VHCLELAARRGPLLGSREAEHEVGSKSPDRVDSATRRNADEHEPRPLRELLIHKRTDDPLVDVEFADVHRLVAHRLTGRMLVERTRGVAEDFAFGNARNNDSLVGFGWFVPGHPGGVAMRIVSPQDLRRLEIRTDERGSAGMDLAAGTDQTD